MSKIIYPSESSTQVLKKNRFKKKKKKTIKEKKILICSYCSFPLNYGHQESCKYAVSN